MEETYYPYIIITDNTFEYSIGPDHPEILLTITGPDGFIKYLLDHNYKEVGDVGGFDVTTKKHKIPLVPNDNGNYNKLEYPKNGNKK